MGYEPAAEPIRELLKRSLSRIELAGYLCVGLGLLRDASSAPTLREVMRLSIRRPYLLRQSALALAHLDDRQATVDLHQMLDDDDNSNMARLSAIAMGIGLVGDRRSIQPLLGALANEQVTQLSRAFAAAALGGITDKETARWNAKVAEGFNYRAAVEAMNDGTSGILDIL
ncbi:MAG: hypothetical protein KDC98_15920 [Planctomycetes bacterium]|nr:hypothetical protein [Planctomycetota bacterium]